MLRRAAGYTRSLVRARRGRTDRPRLLTHIVTFTCNARCVMCDSWKKTSAGDLSLAEIDAIYAQLPRLDAVRLTGGEPFVRRDLPEIVRLATEHLDPAVLHITSNGFLSERIVRFCEERDPRVPLQLMFSVDGMEQKHVEVRGVPHAWRRVTQTLEALAPRQKELNLRLAVNQTIVDGEGARDYEPLHAYLRTLGVNHQTVFAYDTSATYSTATDGEGELEVAPSGVGEFETFGDLSREEITHLLAQMEADTIDLPIPERVAKRYYYDGIRTRLLREHDDHLNPPCVALSSHLRIMPNGDVPTCQFNSKTIGNLRETPFAELWSGERAETQRDWVAGCAGCWAECEVFPNALYSGDILHYAVRGDGRKFLFER